MNSKQIRVRFAPSPTGPLHIGGVRTALYNYLFARKYDGKFILRIEDTDQSRFVPEAEKYIMESFEWCNISFDEGIREGGPFGPYRQSERKDIYRQYAEKLVELGHAYYAFDTPGELEKMRKKLEEQKAANSSYGIAVRMSMTNSLTLPPEDVVQRISAGNPYVIRFKMPDNQDVKIFDEIRNWVIVNTSTLDDKVLFKSDGMPTYHLANIVDDHLMEITHVIRGEEWLPSLPLHALLYRCFGWDEPKFAHLPLLLKPDGKGKLSKRDGDRLGFPVFPIEWKDPKSGEVSSGYRESGFFPGAFVNMLAFLGWNPGTDQELFSMEELISAFTISRVGKSGSRFDFEKAKWYNHQYLQIQPLNDLVKKYKPILTEKNIEATDDYISKVCELIKERADFINEFWDQSYFFFEAPKEYDQKVVKKRWKENTPGIMAGLMEILRSVDDFSSENTEKAVKTWIEEKEVGMGAVMNAFRLCVVGAMKGPHMFDIIALIGKEETLLRIEAGIKRMSNK